MTRVSKFLFDLCTWTSIGPGVFFLVHKVAVGSASRCARTHVEGKDPMAKNIYVGNLSWSTSEEALRETFEQYGEVLSARIITDRDTGRSRGFGFVEMENEDEANAAIDALNGQPLDGRPLTVNEARPRAPRQNRGGGGYGGGRNRY